MIVLLFALGWFGCTAAGSILLVFFPLAGLVLLLAGMLSGYAAVDASVRPTERSPA